MATAFNMLFSSGEVRGLWSCAFVAIQRSIPKVGAKISQIESLLTTSVALLWPTWTSEKQYEFSESEYLHDA